MIYCRLAPDLPPVSVNDALNRGQPDSGSFKFVSVMQTLKYAKQLMRVLHIEPCPVIPEKHNYFIGIPAGVPDLDFCPRSLPRELDCIRNQINKNQSQHRTVSITRRGVADLPLDIAAVRFRLLLVEDLLPEL